MTLQQIIENWSQTDQILYKTPQIKFQSLEQQKTRVINKES